MTQYILTAPQSLNADIKLPASKSISNRALVIHALSKGKILPENLSDCDDTQVVIEALRSHSDTIDIKAAGTAMRFMTAYYAATQGTHIITGTDRMKHRPIAILVNALRQLGADIEYIGEEGYPPLRIHGKHLTGGILEIPGNISSQYISALLMIGPVLQKGITLKLTGKIVSHPYIDLTLCTMRKFKAEAEWTTDNIISVKPKSYQPVPYYIENDWSSSSYWYEMLALCKDQKALIHLEGLFFQSKQGDSIIKDIFKPLGIKTTFAPFTTDTTTTVTLTKTPCLTKRYEYDFTKCPDLAQTIIVTCCCLGIPFEFTGLASLKIKETDRIDALKKELYKLGYIIHDKHDDTLLWDGERCKALMLPVDTYEDHRMAMAFAPAAFTNSSLSINHPEVVSKSYPRYWKDLEAVHFKIKKK
jgi:3-phosphoshikimate 1-carboxyvinyltransferase